MLFGQRKGLYRLKKSCRLAQVGELAAAINEKALLLDDEKGINSDVQVGGRFCGKAVLSKKCAFLLSVLRSVPTLNEDFSKGKGVLYGPQTLFCQLHLKYCICLKVMDSGRLL